MENNAPTIQNHSVDSNVGGRGGYSRSGDSYARRSGARDRGGLARRAGRARTGTSGNVSGGAVVNNGQEVINAAGASEMSSDESVPFSMTLQILGEWAGKLHLATQ